MTKVKICGITEASALDAATKSGAHFAGFVFHAKSARNIAPEKAAHLAESASASITTVGLFVDPDDDTLRHILSIAPLGMVQLHGNETPARVAAVKILTGLPVMKAIRIGTRDDMAGIDAYASIADWLLFDAKVDGAQGGTGSAFDWTILENFKTSKPWMLAGGLHADNVGEALAQLRPDAVDVSSGVESAPGVKDACKIAAFVESVRHA